MPPKLNSLEVSQRSYNASPAQYQQASIGRVAKGSLPDNAIPSNNLPHINVQPHFDDEQGHRPLITYNSSGPGQGKRNTLQIDRYASNELAGNVPDVQKSAPFEQYNQQKRTRRQDMLLHTPANGPPRLKH